MGVLLAACGAGRAGHEATVARSQPAAVAAPATAATEPASVGQAGDLLSSQDRQRLEKLCAERSRSGAADGYVIGADDLLEVRVPDLLDAQPEATARTGATGPAAVAGTPVFQQGLRVSGAGDVALPMLGVIPVAGRTPAALEREIERRLLQAGILRAPQVSVLVTEYRSGVVAVVGSVERPGLYPVTKPGATIADFIWAAGGPTRDSGRVVQFTPQHDSSGSPARLDLEVLLHDSGSGACGSNPAVRPGDVVSVSPAGTAHVAGWVDKPGSVPVTRGLTVSGAVAAAGGALFAADPSEVAVKRVLGPGEERSWTIDLDAVARGDARDVPLTDGDVVTVPAHGGRVVPYGLWTVGKEVVHIGGSVPLF